MKKLLCAIFFLLSIFFVYAEDTDELKYILSLDTHFTMTALKNYGFGIGMNYEQKLTDFLSIKPGMGHMVCFSDITAVTVNLQLFLYYYPLSSGLDKLYIGLGNGCDFIMYINDMPQDTVISLTPVMGWKWRASPFLMIEPLLGWKFFVSKTNNYENMDRYLNGGFQWGLNFKVFVQNN
jgi:hypothetical protein